MPEIATTLAGDTTLGAELHADLAALVAELADSPPLEAESRYVDLFDRGRSTSISLFEHVYGNSRSRGPAMIELRKRYLDAGLEPSPCEMPDHLPLVLEYLSCCDADETQNTLGEIAAIVRQVGNALLKRDSRYAAVMAAVLALGSEPGLDRKAESPPPEDLDRDYEVRPAFSFDEKEQRTFVAPGHFA